MEYKINDILEALRININVDWTDNDPSEEFKTLYNQLSSIQMKTSYKKQLQYLVDKAIYDLNLLRVEKGEPSKFSNQKVLKIKNDNFMFNLDGGRYLVEFGNNKLIDSSGHEYDCFVMDTFDFLDVLDHLKETYNKK